MSIIKISQVKEIFSVAKSATVKCSICQEDVCEPKILRCNHIFCTLCLSKYITQCTTNHKPVACPNCKSLIRKRANYNCPQLQDTPFHKLMNKLEVHTGYELNPLPHYKADYAQLTEEQHRNSVVGKTRWLSNKSNNNVSKPTNSSKSVEKRRTSQRNLTKPKVIVKKLSINETLPQLKLNESCNRTQPTSPTEQRGNDLVQTRHPSPVQQNTSTRLNISKPSSPVEQDQVRSSSRQSVHTSQMSVGNLTRSPKPTKRITRSMSRDGSPGVRSRSGSPNQPRIRKMQRCKIREHSSDMFPLTRNSPQEMCQVVIATPNRRVLKSSNKSVTNETNSPLSKTNNKLRQSRRRKNEESNASDVLVKNSISNMTKTIDLRTPPKTSKKNENFTKSSNSTPAKTSRVYKKRELLSNDSMSKFTESVGRMFGTKTPSKASSNLKNNDKIQSKNIVKLTKSVSDSTESEESINIQALLLKNGKNLFKVSEQCNRITSMNPGNNLSPGIINPTYIPENPQDIHNLSNKVTDWLENAQFEDSTSDVDNNECSDKFPIKCQRATKSFSPQNVKNNSRYYRLEPDIKETFDGLLKRRQNQDDHNTDVSKNRRHSFDSVNKYDILARSLEKERLDALLQNSMVDERPRSPMPKKTTHDWSRLRKELRHPEFKKLDVTILSAKKSSTSDEQKRDVEDSTENIAIIETPMSADIEEDAFNAIALAERAAPKSTSDNSSDLDCNTKSKIVAHPGYTVHCNPSLGRMEKIFDKSPKSKVTATASNNEIKPGCYLSNSLIPVIDIMTQSVHTLCKDDANLILVQKLRECTHQLINQLETNMEDLSTLTAKYDHIKTAVICPKCNHSFHPNSNNQLKTVDVGTSIDGALPSRDKVGTNDQICSQLLKSLVQNNSVKNNIPELELECPPSMSTENKSLNTKFAETVEPVRFPMPKPTELSQPQKNDPFANVVITDIRCLNEETTEYNTPSTKRRQFKRIRHRSRSSSSSGSDHVSKKRSCSSHVSPQSRASGDNNYSNFMQEMVRDIAQVNSDVSIDQISSTTTCNSVKESNYLNIPATSNSISNPIVKDVSTVIDNSWSSDEDIVWNTPEHDTQTTIIQTKPRPTIDDAEITESATAFDISTLEPPCSEFPSFIEGTEGFMPIVVPLTRRFTPPPGYNDGEDLLANEHPDNVSALPNSTILKNMKTLTPNIDVQKLKCAPILQPHTEAAKCNIIDVDTPTDSMISVIEGTPVRRTGSRSKLISNNYEPRQINVTESMPPNSKYVQEDDCVKIIKNQNPILIHNGSVNSRQKSILNYMLQYDKRDNCSKVSDSNTNVSIISEPPKQKNSTVQIHKENQDDLVLQGESSTDKLVAETTSHHYTFRGTNADISQHIRDVSDKTDVYDRNDLNTSKVVDNPGLFLSEKQRTNRLSNALTIPQMNLNNTGVLPPSSSRGSGELAIAPISTQFSPSSFQTPNTQLFALPIACSTPKHFKYTPERVLSISTSRLGVDENILVNEFCEKFGFEFFRDLNPHLTHLVTSTKGDNWIKDHTAKYVHAVAFGKWIVSIQWVKDSFSQNKVLPEDPYEVCDLYGVAGPKSSRLYGHIQPLFRNFDFAVVDIVEFTMKDLQAILQRLGARFFPTVSMLAKQCGRIKIILTGMVDTVTEKSQLYQEWYRKYNIVTVQLEWMVRSIGQYQTLTILPSIACPLDEPLTGYPPELCVDEEYEFETSESME